MELTTFLSLAVDWLSFDELTDCLCIILGFAVFSIVRNLFKQTR